MIEKLIQNKTTLQVEALPYKNSELSIDERVEDLLERMTLDEKVAQMLCIWGLKKTYLADEDGNIKLDDLTNQFSNGLGQIGRLSDTYGGRTANEMAELANSIQKILIEGTRLGIPVIFHEECLHGLAGMEATSYPQPIGMASTFNPELIEKVYSAIAEETRIRGAHQALTPVLDVARDPRWGRVEETFGEDPYLISQLGLAAIKGLQGDGTFRDKKSLIATLKHFAAHGQPESGSNCGPANISERVLRDTFLFPFKEAVQKGNVLSVMASYNEIDGIPSHANTWLLKDLLRQEWGFDGFIVSDYYAITELNEKEETVSHKLAKDKKDAALLAVKAGVNIELPDIDCYPLIADLVNEGQIEVSEIDELVGPLLKHKFLMGLFEEPYVDVDSINIHEKLERNRPLAKQAALETITLLKNEGDLLPLKNEPNMTIAVIGPNADRRLLGGYSGKPKYYSTVLEGIKEKLGDDANILYHEGCKITIGGSWDEDSVTPADPEENSRLIEEAIKVAEKSDKIILVIGGNEQTSREAWNKNHLGDRPSLDLYGSQNELVKAMLNTGKPVVVVLFNGRPKSISFINQNVPSILECWYLGQETGTAVADVIFGDYNPSGKLPISFPRSVGHIPCFYNHKPSSRRGYLFDDISALYAFGYGLSYTNFTFENLQLDKERIGIDESAFATVEITNAGDRGGHETVQLYVHDVVSSVTRPVKELKGFKKIYLEPGETKTVMFEISPESLAFTNIAKEFVVEPGEFEIMVGNSSRDEDLKKIILEVV